jgi:hypothetical protein
MVGESKGSVADQDKRPATGEPNGMTVQNMLPCLRIVPNTQRLRSLQAEQLPRFILQDHVLGKTHLSLCCCQKARPGCCHFRHGHCYVGTEAGVGSVECSQAANPFPGCSRGLC